MNATTRHIDAGKPEAMAPDTCDPLHLDAASVLAMLRRATDAVNAGDREALAREMTGQGEPFTWDGSERVCGASSVASLVVDHRVLVPSSELQFSPSRIVFEDEHAWAVINWAWSVSAGEAICKLACEDRSWRIAAIDPMGDRVRHPEPDFDPRSAIDELRGVVSFLALIECSLQADAEPTRRSGDVDHGAGRAARGLAARVDCAAMPVAVCAHSRRALALTEDQGHATITLELRRASDQWRVAAVARTSTWELDMRTRNAADAECPHTEA